MPITLRHTNKLYKGFDMIGVIKTIKNGIYIHSRVCGSSTVGFHTVAELLSGELVDLTRIIEDYFGKITIKKKVVRRFSSIKRGQAIDYYNKELGLNLPVPGTFSIKECTND